MASTTGIELGPDTCVLVSVRKARAGGAVVGAIHRIEAAEWPSHDVALAKVLRGVRRAMALPRRVVVVAWGLPDDATDDETARSALRPFEAAGFRIASVLSPPQALARLAAARSRTPAGEAAAWLALNTHGAAIAIVRGGELLFSRTFQWTYQPELGSSKAQLLQRYSLVAHLAPELRRGLAAVRASHGLKIETAVTCGDLPELRSLTMPLIEELDLEVETLDSTDGLVAGGKTNAARLAEWAPALRLALAAALAPAPNASRMPALSRIAAGLALVAVLGWGAARYWPVDPVRTAQPAAAARATPAVRPTSDARRSPTAGAAAPGSQANVPPPAATTQPPVLPPAAAKTEPRPASPAASTVAPPVAKTPPPVTPPAVAKAEPRPVAPATSTVPPPAVKAPPRATPPAVAKTEPRPAPSTVAPPGAKTPPPATPAAVAKAEPRPIPPATSTVPAPVVKAPPPATPRAGAKAEPRPIAPVTSTVPPVVKAPPRATPPAVAKAEPRSVPPPTPTVPPASSSIATPRPEPSPTRSVSTSGAGVEPGGRAASDARPAPPLKDPLPQIDTVLIDQERRLALIEGAIVGVGDAVGPRVVVQIDRDGVLLREPSGRVVRVPLRSRPTS